MDRRRISNCCRKSKGIGDSIDGHLDDIVNDIKEEVDQIFGIGINSESIINIINSKIKYE